MRATPGRSRLLIGWLLGLALLACGAPPESAGPVAGWAHYGGDAGGTRHSPLTQIHPGNVGDLEAAWIFHTGDVADGRDGRGGGAFQATPILIDDTLYFCSPYNRVFAIDAETGEERWRASLPAGGQATPITYRLAEGRRQYVVIAAGGHATLGTTPGDSLVAFAVP